MKRPPRRARGFRRRVGGQPFARALAGLGLYLLAGACAPTNEAGPVEKLVITMIGKSDANPVFASARAGALAAAKKLSEQNKALQVKIHWRTPPREDPVAQARLIREAVKARTQAIIVSCSDGETLRRAIDDAVEAGVPVMTFDSDAPESRRFAFYGAKDSEIGARIVDELVALMGRRGKIAILAGNPAASNLKRRVEGVRRAAARFPGVEIVGVFNHEETVEAAVAEFRRVNKAHPDLAGWAMVGGWPLFSHALLHEIDPAKLKVVAVDALPVQLPYVEKGVVPVLLGLPTYRWGYVSVQRVVDELHHKKKVETEDTMKLIKVYKDNLGGWARQLRAWGYEGVPRRYLRM